MLHVGWTLGRGVSRPPRGEGREVSKCTGTHASPSQTHTYACTCIARTHNHTDTNTHPPTPRGKGTHTTLGAKPLLSRAKVGSQRPELVLGEAGALHCDRGQRRDDDEAICGNVAEQCAIPVREAGQGSAAVAQAWHREWGQRGATYAYPGPDSAIFGGVGQSLFALSWRRIVCCVWHRAGDVTMSPRAVCSVEGGPSLSLLKPTTHPQPLPHL